MTSRRTDRAPNTRAFPRISAVTESIWWIGRSNWGGLPALTELCDSNIYLLKGHEFDVLVDSGGSASLAKLERNIRRAGSEPRRI